MKRIFRSALALVFGVTVTFAQSPAGKAKSPKTVLEEYWTFETPGGRLTEAGWNKEAALFLRPTPPPSKKVIIVIDRDYAVSDFPARSVSPSTALVNVDLRRTIGKIDPELRFTEESSHWAKEGILFKLVLTGNYRRIGPDGKELQQGTGPPEWKIDTKGTDTVIWLTLETAIRYITETHDTLADPSIKANAAETLAKLRRYVRP